MSDTLTTAELEAIAKDAKAALAAGKFYPAPVVRLLAVSVPRLIATIRTATDALTLACEHIETAETQLASRDAQIARLRQVVDNGMVV